MSNRQSHRFWQQHIEAWRSSGLTQAEYARQHQLVVKRFSYHKRRYFSESGAKPTASSSTAALVPVTVTEDLPAPAPEPVAPGITLTSPGGFRIELAAGFDHQALKQVLNVLGAR